MNDLESGVMRAILGGMSPEDAARLELLRYGVQKRIQCPVSKEVLDVRRAVLVEIVDSDDKAVENMVLSAQTWDDIGPILRDGIAKKGWRIADVIDGRKLHDPPAEEQTDTPAGESAGEPDLVYADTVPDGEVVDSAQWAGRRGVYHAVFYLTGPLNISTTENLRYGYTLALREVSTARDGFASVDIAEAHAREVMRKHDYEVTHMTSPS